jgi:hypothetical protein
MKFLFRSMKLLFVMVPAILLYPGSASAQHYTQTNLVSDIVGNAAVHDQSNQSLGYHPQRYHAMVGQ